MRNTHFQKKKNSDWIDDKIWSQCNFTTINYQCSTLLKTIIRQFPKASIRISLRHFQQLNKPEQIKYGYFWPSLDLPHNVQSPNWFSALWRFSIDFSLYFDVVRQFYCRYGGDNSSILNQGFLANSMWRDALKRKRHYKLAKISPNSRVLSPKIEKIQIGWWSFRNWRIRWCFSNLGKSILLSRG